MKRIVICIVLVISLISTSNLVAQVTANQPSDIDICDDVLNNGQEEFDLTITEAAIIGAQDPTNLFVTFYETQADATNAINAIANPTTYVNTTNPQIIFARLEDGSNGDYDTTNFIITVLMSPEPVTPDPILICDDNGDGMEVFELTIRESQILNGENWILSYFESYINAVDNTGAINNPTAYVNIINPQITFVRVEIPSTGCFAIVELELIVLPTPETNVVTDYEVLDADGDGSALFDLTSKIPEILNGQTDVNVTFYESQADADASVNPFLTPEAYTNTINPQTIFARLENFVDGCFETINFEIFANPNLGVEDDNFVDLIVYPNPVQNILFIESQKQIESVKIYNLHGQLVKEKASNNMDVSNLATGLYFVKVTVDRHSIIKKFIKN